jgi:hypothetical protein
MSLQIIIICILPLSLAVPLPNTIDTSTYNLLRAELDRCHEQAIAALDKLTTTTTTTSSSTTKRVNEADEPTTTPFDILATTASQKPPSRCSLAAKPKNKCANSTRSTLMYFYDEIHDTCLMFMNNRCDDEVDTMNNAYLTKQSCDSTCKLGLLLQFKFQISYFISIFQPT